MLPPAVGSYLMRLSVVRMLLPLVRMAFQLFPKWQASGLGLVEEIRSLVRIISGPLLACAQHRPAVHT